MFSYNLNSISINTKKLITRCLSSIQNNNTATTSFNKFFKTHQFIVGKDEADMRLDHFLHYQTGLPTSVKLNVNNSNNDDDSNVILADDFSINNDNELIIENQSIVKTTTKKKDKSIPKHALKSFSDFDIKRIRSMILYQDDEIMVVNKPSGIATQGGPKIRNHIDGLLNVLQFEHPEPPRLVHRLDKNTTGALILGRTRSAAGKLSFMFRESTIEKIYTAIVTKFLPRDLFKKKIEAPIVYGGKPPFEKVLCITDESSPLLEKSRPSFTEYQVLAGIGNHSLLRLFPQTGRKHQLRVHCASILTAPILGDSKYGYISKSHHDKKDDDEKSGPMYLHLSKVIIRNWRTSEGKILSKPIEVFCPLPNYFNKKCEDLFSFSAISTDSLLKIKKKIIKILEETENQVPSKIRLYKYQNNSGPTLALDIDYETIEGLNIKDNEVLILCFWDKIINDWESINIEQPEPLTYESDVEPEEDFEDGINKIMDVACW
ncbi:17185_t:CDS:10 [Entrophospora sp. SA101]|nr:17185_t:CDS:10 [Entrophospora sp. SA101]